jgi:hypothetical protein
MPRAKGRAKRRAADLSRARTYAAVAGEDGRGADKSRGLARDEREVNGTVIVKAPKCEANILVAILMSSSARTSGA